MVLVICSNATASVAGAAGPSGGAVIRERAGEPDRV